MSRRIISNPRLVVNDVLLGIVPKSFSYTEGLGEQDVVQTAGEICYSYIEFDVMNTVENIDLLRSWKINKKSMIGTATGTSDSGWKRTFNNSTIINDYEVPLGSAGAISLKLISDPAI